MLSAAFRLLSSLKLTVVLLVVLCLALGAGTIIESMQNAEAARVVYYATWFQALLGLFALNTLAAIIDRGIGTRWRIGFALTHLSMVLILGGAFATDQWKVEGQLALYEGEDSATFLTFPHGDKGVPVDLGYKVKLNAFEIDRYPGTMRPAMFRSKVTVTPPQGAPFNADIEMNKQLTFMDFSLFQSSYQEGAGPGGSDMTVLSVSKDPGEKIVFLGYLLLVLGMCVVLTTRIIQKRIVDAAQAQIAAAKKAKTAAVPVALLAAALASLAIAPSLQAAPIPDLLTDAQVETLRRLPVQHDGREMPLDTMAREVVHKVTGEWRPWNMDPVEMVAGWTFDSSYWATALIIALPDSVAGHIGVPATGFGSFQGLVQNPALTALMDQAQALEHDEKPLQKVHKDAQKLEERLVAFQGFLNHESIRPVPAATRPERWSVPSPMVTPADLLAAQTAIRAGKTPGHYPSEAAISREITYNQVDPWRLAWLVLVPSAVFGYLTWRRSRKWADIAAVTGLVLGSAAMTWGIAQRWLIADRIPASNMFESLLFLGWGVGFFAIIASIFMRNRLVIFNATAMSALTMLLVDLLPMDGFIHPMPPVLSGTPWLAIHVPIIMVSYAVLALGVFVAHMQIGLGMFPGKQHKAQAMADLNYWYMFVGSILLITGILTGSIWAASSWGRYWGWDPKEVWSLIAFLAYMAILHGRFDKWLGNFGVAVASIAAFWMILMTYIGVNYVLASGMHSYGFGGSDVVFWMVTVAVAEIAFLVSAWLIRRSRGAAAQ